MAETIRCSRCDQYLALEEFAPSQRKQGSWCRSCRTAYMREYHAVRYVPAPPRPRKVKPTKPPRTFKQRWLDGKGYVMLRNRDHLLSMKNGAVYEHRLVLFDRIGYGPHTCHWCGTHVNWRCGLQVDHVNGVHDDNSATNVVQSCGPCNRQRQAEARRAISFAA